MQFALVSKDQSEKTESEMVKCRYCGKKIYLREIVHLCNIIDNIKVDEKLYTIRFRKSDGAYEIWCDGRFRGAAKKSMKNGYDEKKIIRRIKQQNKRHESEMNTLKLLGFGKDIETMLKKD